MVEKDGETTLTVMTFDESLKKFSNYNVLGELWNTELRVTKFNEKD